MRFYTEMLSKFPSIPSNQVSGKSGREEISQTFGRHNMTGNQFGAILRKLNLQPICILAQVFS